MRSHRAASVQVHKVHDGLEEVCAAHAAVESNAAMGIKLRLVR